MDLEKFNILKEKIGSNPELLSVVSELETQARTLFANKENTVGEIKKFRDVKQTIAELLGLDREIPADELITSAQTKLSDYQKKIDSFQKNASSKDLEVASFREKFQTMEERLQELSKGYEAKEQEIKLNSLKDSFRKALTANRITNPEAIDVAMDAYIQKAGATQDLNALAKSIAEQKPFLTTSLHKGGSETMPHNRTDYNTNNLANIPLKDRNARRQAIQEKIDASK